MGSGYWLGKTATFLPVSFILPICFILAIYFVSFNGSSCGLFFFASDLYYLMSLGWEIKKISNLLKVLPTASSSLSFDPELCATSIIVFITPRCGTVSSVAASCLSVFASPVGWVAIDCATQLEPVQFYFIVVYVSYYNSIIIYLLNTY